MKNTILLLLSTVGALCLFASPSKIMLLLEMAIFLAVALSIRFKDETSGCKRGVRVSAFVLAALFTLIGIHTFANTLLRLGLPWIGAAVLSVACGLGAFYALYRLACWIDERICCLLGVSVAEPATDKWKANWFFPVCALAFFFLEARNAWHTEYVYSVLAALGIAVVVACRAPSLLAQCRKDPWQWQAFCAFTAVGICWFQREAFLAAAGGQAILGTVCAAAAFFFVYVCVCALYRSLRSRLSGIFSDVRPAEWLLYGGMVLLTLCFVTVTFLKTDAFYGTAYPYDIIYTSDSHKLIQENAYLWLICGENDLRQPLFAVFAAPFAGAAYLIGSLLPVSAAWNALLLNVPQLLLLFLANFLLTKMLKLTRWRRVGFLILMYLSYPTVLFSLMMEQYLIAYFYLIWLLYSVCEEKPEPLAFCGATGTLLTSAVTLPFLSKRKPHENFGAWFWDMLNGGIGFVIAVLAFGRLEILLDAAVNFLDLNRFSGESLTFAERLCQYTAFVPGCLLAPEAGICENVWGNISWQLVRSDTIHWAGVVILALCGFSAVWNQEKKSSVLAAVWIGFSFLVLCVMGWGTQENGLILYALYFGWAFLVLLYQLVEKIESLCHFPYLTAAACVIGTALLAAVNMPAIAEMIAFGAANYPL